MHADEFSEFSQAFGLWRMDGLTALTAIHGFANLFQRGLFGPLTDEQRTSMATIAQYAARASQAWHHGSAYLHAHDTTTHFGAVELTQVVEQVQSNLRVICPTSDYLLPDNPPQIHADWHLLSIALGYLLYPEDQQTNCTHPAPSLRVIQLAPGAVEVVIDSALQLRDERDRADLFLHPGSCLAIAARIVQTHSSTLTAAHTEGVLRFTFTLPVLADGKP